MDPRQRKLFLRTRRDMVKTQSGGGFGATVSTTRWNKFGTFTAKFQSGSTGSGIVTAFLLSNPVFGEEISFELTGKDPKKVVTNYYRRIPTTTVHHHHRHLQHQQHQHHHEAHIVSHSYPHSHSSHSHLESHEETHDLNRDSTKHDLVYKLEWNEKQIRWSVDGKVLRTGLPKNAMQLQLTIWDAGYTPETAAWAGGKTQYGADNLNEYVTTMSSRLDARIPKKVTSLGKARSIQATQVGSQEGRKKKKSTKKFFEIAVLSLIKWTFVLLAIICGAAYFTSPKSKSGVVTLRSSTRDSRDIHLGVYMKRAAALEPQHEPQYKIRFKSTAQRLLEAIVDNGGKDKYFNRSLRMFSTQKQGFYMCRGL
ncbi:hypothetical protein BGZ65_003496 [Modicella reniformis]|uniref:GH16 domain-containing protein n=1 Tax=Modicella reniformis TaxID=1440133 RepID=A0A9P6MI25_9FUNG|nr:hypothetical protein BGZ65_003496 [Modicella reniformis]